jgi:type VI secretion system protein ImpA
MPLREDILNPISDESPGGTNLYYHPTFEQIKEARREEMDAPQGEWERDIKTADYKAVLKLSEEAIATKSKDLQLAAWLTEALIYERRFEGLNDGLVMMKGLIENFWDTLYPELEDGEAEFRASPLEWFGNYFDPGKGSSPALAVRRVPLTKSGLDWFQYKEALKIPREEEASSSEGKAEARRTAQEEGKLLPEDFDAAFKETPKPFYRKLETDIAACAESLAALDQVCGEKFGRDAPGFRALRTALEEVGNTVKILLQEKLKQDPDPIPVEEAAAADAEVAALVDQAGGGAGEDGAGAGEISAGGELRSRQDAVRYLVAAAHFLRRSEPSDPVPYLILRSLRWGELRAGGDTPPPSVLQAPTSDVRIALKNSALSGDWQKVLETAEAVGATGCGRAWLDLQRYAIQACDALGYTAAAKAIRSELKAVLTDFPQLTSMTLTDDTGTANPETLAWLLQEGLLTPQEPV